MRPEGRLTATLFLKEELVRTPGGYRALIRREGWSDTEALANAIIRIDTLERCLYKYINQQTDFADQIERAEHAAELATLREDIANERTGDRDEKIGRLEARLRDLGDLTAGDPFEPPHSAASGGETPTPDHTTS